MITTYDNHIFLKRFYRIFGVDGPEGSMSASNLLYTIPLELGIQLDNTKLNDNTYLDYLAFIVLAVFRIMTLYNKVELKLTIESIEKIGTIKLLKDTILNGLLSKFYSGLSNTSFVSYINDIPNNILYIFSHGGITSTIMNEKDISGTKMNEKDISGIIGLKSHLTTEYNTLIDLSNKMSGGTLELASKIVMERLERINEVYIDIMINSFRKPDNIKYDYKPTINMLLALSLSSPYKPNLDMKFILNSPITPGIDEIEKDLFYCSDKNIVQIFGHVPKGFATNISKHKSPTNSKIYTYLINLDYSQSYKYTNLGGETNCFLLFEKSNIKNGPTLESIIDLKNLIKNKLGTTNVNPTNTNTNKFIANTKISGETLTLTKNIFDMDFINYDDYIPKTPDYKYHGLYSDNSKQEFYVFSTLNGFNKILVIKIKKKDKQQSTKDKYYKYKLKYLKLKMSLNNQI